MMKPLDVVSTPGGGIAIVKEVDRNHASITYFNGCNPKGEKNAWWGEGGEEGLVVLDNLPRVLTNCMAHPFGSHASTQGDSHFPIDREQQHGPQSNQIV